MKQEEYPLPSFNFKVIFSGPAGTWEDTSFKEVSEFGSKVETEKIIEGGDAGQAYTVPKSVAYKNLILKRGIAGISSQLVKWCKSVLEEGFNKPIVPMQISVQLLNESQEPVRVWVFENAYPVSWDVEGFNSMENKVAIEKIEFCYHFFKREK
ncbi:MAG: phage tail protein [Desulfosarcina sp.]|nr:phage tail protein [Desulfobacterales bacterium]